MHSKIFDISRLKHQYKNLSQRQQWLIVGGGIILLAVLLIGAGRFYIQHAGLFDSRIDEEREELFREANQHYGEERYQEAASGFEEYASQSEGYARFHALIRAARAWNRDESYHKSIDVYTKALQTDGVESSEYPFEHAKIHGDLSHNFEHIEDYDAALRHTRQRIETLQQIDPEDEEDSQTAQQLIASSNQRVQSLQSQRDTESFRRMDEHAQQANESVSGNDISRQDMQNAVEQYRRALDILEANPDLPQTDQREEEYRQEIQVLREALQENPEQSE